MENIEKLVVRLTPDKPFQDALEKGQNLEYLKLALRSDNSLYEEFYNVIKLRAMSGSSQTRFLCLQLTHYVFCRSAHFRQILCNSYCLPFLRSFTRKLPAPEQFRKRLVAILPVVIDRWCEKFGGIYGQLALLKREFRPRETEEDRLNRQRNRSIDILADSICARWDPMLVELENLVELLVPSGERFEAIEQTDEYRSIVLSGIRDNRALLLKCAQDVDVLKANLERFECNPEVTAKINAFVERVSRIEARLEVIGVDDDEFEDVTESEHEEDEFEDVDE